MGERRLVSTEERRTRLAVRHRLVAEQRIDDVAKIADDVVALHSSDPATVYMSALARMANPQLSAVDAALYDARSLVRHHAMRRTLWVMSLETARRAHASTTVRIAAAERKRTLAALAGSPAIDHPQHWYEAAAAEIAGLLADRGPMTTRQIGDLLPHLVIPIVFGAGTKNPAAINAHTKILQGAGFDAALVRTRPNGSWNSSEYVWDAVDEWLATPITGADTRRAAGELLDHWLRRFGPATDIDIRWWFGWTAKLTATALADRDAIAVELDDGAPAWLAAGDADPLPEVGPWVRLLPGLDVTTMGWKQREWYVPAERTNRLFDRFGNAGPTIWANGRVVGGWIQRPNGEIAFELLEPLTSEEHTLLDQAATEVVTALGNTVVKPRFPARNQGQLLARS